MIVKRAIVTGATGAVGTALVKVLVSNNIEVLVICRENSKRNKNIPKHELVSKLYCDLTDFSKIRNQTKKKWDVFYHFAWMGTTGDERNNMYLQNSNVKYALDAVKVAKEFGCDKFIGAGSQAEYGRVDGVLKSDTPVFPENGYGIAKLCAGQMTRELAHQLGMEHNWVRILSVYGPNDGQKSMVMSTIEKLRNNQVPEFTKGEQMWDYLYSGDAAIAFRLIGEKGVDGKTYILGSGKVKPLYEYIKIIREAIDSNAKLGIGVIPYSDKQVMHLQADIEELKKDTDWEPKTNFIDGIKSILNSI